ncbi:nuclear transport factor 2 family protein [Novosphingobium capsulatum]|uniref:nuclear transport factor 2 family protein n=1 Tax=Novosphingobium capsulatum TaxID=13688 RepID=UPI00078864D2|nr:nuclear transport factor 2 family protein [Novosphingobium capsulatum]WQD95201.1 nuclear transport factor 2 family protein [Novosphingobium capsulatum]
MTYPPPPCPADVRQALADLVTAYAMAVDDIGNAAGVAALFAPDGCYDLTSLGMDRIVGRAGIQGFFEAAFDTMASNAHFVGNVALGAYDAAANTAQVTAYGHAFSLGTDGALLEVKARYAFDLAQHEGTWRIARLGMTMLLPPVHTPAP